MEFVETLKNMLIPVPKKSQTLGTNLKNDIKTTFNLRHQNLKTTFNLFQQTGGSMNPGQVDAEKLKDMSCRIMEVRRCWERIVREQRIRRRIKDWMALPKLVFLFLKVGYVQVVKLSGICTV